MVNSNSYNDARRYYSNLKTNNNPINLWQKGDIRSDYDKLLDELALIKREKESALSGIPNLTPTVYTSPVNLQPVAGSTNLPSNISLAEQLINKTPALTAESVGYNPNLEVSLRNELLAPVSKTDMFSKEFEANLDAILRKTEEQYDETKKSMYPAMNKWGISPYGMRAINELLAKKNQTMRDIEATERYKRLGDVESIYNAKENRRYGYMSKEAEMQAQLKQLLAKNEQETEQDYQNRLEKTRMALAERGWNIEDLMAGQNWQQQLLNAQETSNVNQAKTAQDWESQKLNFGRTNELADIFRQRGWDTSDLDAYKKWQESQQAKQQEYAMQIANIMKPKEVSPLEKILGTVLPLAATYFLGAPGKFGAKTNAGGVPKVNIDKGLDNLSLEDIYGLTDDYRYRTKNVPLETRLML